MNRTWLILAMVVQSVVLTLIVFRTAPGRDEWGHLSAGLMHWRFGDYSPYRVNPPMVRLWATWPLRIVSFAEPAWTFSTPIDSAKERTEWSMARALVSANGARTIELVQLCRLMMLPIALAGTCFAYLVSIQVTGSKWASNIAAWLFALSPNILANAAMITPDVSLVVFGLLATLVALRWRTSQTWLNSCAFGMAIGLCVASKFTGAVFAISAALLIVTVACRSTHSRRIWAQFFGIVAISLFILCATYEFDQIFKPLGDFRFVSSSLAGDSTNRFAECGLASILMPIPAEYLRGIDLQWSEFEGKYDSYLCGRWQSQGWWYYYLVALAVKEPTPLYVLLLSGVATWLTSRLHRRGRNGHALFANWLIVCLPSLLLFVLVSSQTGFNHHFRYVLPCLPALFIIAGAAAESLQKTCPWSRRIAVGLVCAYSAASLSVLPRSYSFFSYAVGGPAAGHRYLDNSNLEWGQDLLTAIDWIEAHPEREVYLLYSVREIDVTKLAPGVHDGFRNVAYSQTRNANLPTKAGWWIVFQQPRLEVTGKWFASLVSTEVLSPSVAVFHITEVPVGTDIDQQ